MDDTLSPLVDAGAVPKSTPSLPLELIHYIIKLGLPPVRFDAFRERYELLRTFSLVSKSWTSLAQAELQRHLYINSRATYEALDVAINAPEETTFSRRVLSIRLGPERRSWLREDLHGLLKGLLSCEEVWACDREGPGTLLIGPLSSASRRSQAPPRRCVHSRALPLLGNPPVTRRAFDLGSGRHRQHTGLPLADHFSRSTLLGFRDLG
ncbi:hypothetical protein BCR35DRAFT_31680 [Leucosporidium creatinivorum]|uniref:F-box domain-containing protein n=1 Tax=Leucosporidium creatinivorum TaxID=106004 RepID=A0A1Y2FVS4_9BASI|nr:hypothetical protein BCR35DRAFT_31680 [Leucosporidium creatinivorum]